MHRKGETIGIYFQGRTLVRLDTEFPQAWADTAEKNRSVLINNMVHFALDNGYDVPGPLMTDMQRMRDEFDLVCKLLVEKGLLDEGELGDSLKEWLLKKGIIRV